MRVPVDLTWARELESFVEAQLAASPATDAIESQTDGVFAAGYCRDLGLLHYAQGTPLDAVRALFRRSTEYTIGVFRMRPSREAWESARDDDGDIDVSLTNSCRALHALELALSCGALDLAESLAPFIWDPPNASYLGPGSVVCTAEEQHVAYALRDLLLGHASRSDALRALPSLDVLDPALRARVWLLVSLAASDPAAVVIALHALHQQHTDRVRDSATLHRLDDLLDVPSLAYTALACARLSRATLPPPDGFFPVRLACAAAPILKEM